MKIGIAIVATNSYFVLGLRFIRRFQHFYKGKAKIKFIFFSDTDPREYIDADIEYIPEKHTSWVDGTNSKFTNILKAASNVDFIYYFDADTNIHKEFTEKWFLTNGLVGGEHFANRTSMKDIKNYDRTHRSAAYIPFDTPHPQMYYYGAFFGGKSDHVKAFCEVLINWQKKDKSWGYEPGVNDESYINKYFHYNPPNVIPLESFPFSVSDKGGIGETRDMSLNIENLKKEILLNKDKLWDIKNNTIIIN